MTLTRVSILEHDSPSQQLIVTWQDPDNRAIHPVAILGNEGERFSFSYLQHVRKVSGFDHFPGFPRKVQPDYSDHLFDFFGSRVLSAKRADYEQYVEKLDLSASSVTPWELLVKSTGRINGDTVQLFPVPRQEADGRLTLPIVVAGIRYFMTKSVKFAGEEWGPYKREELESLLDGLQRGQRLGIVREEGNTSSDHAFLVLESSGHPIGYLPDWIGGEFGALIDEGKAELIVKHTNAPEMGWHLRILAELALSTSGDALFASDDWDLFHD